MPNSSNHIPNSYNPDHQIDDLIGVPPNWLLRSGITVVFIVISVILLLSTFIKYPDKITAKGIMTSEYPPIEHFNITSGIVEEIFIKNGEIVKENEPIIYIKNSVKREDLHTLISFIEEYRSVKDIPDYLNLYFPNDLQLGEIQKNYSQFQLLFSQFQQTLKQSNVFQQIKTLKKEIEDTRSLRNILTAEKKYSLEELALIERDFLRTVELNNEGAISDLDREKVESEWLRYQKQYSNLDQGIIQNKIREEQLVLESQKIAEQRASKVQLHQYDIAQTLNTLKSNIIDWEQKYFISAEISGEVVFIPNLTEDIYVAPNTSLLSIIPTNNSNKKQIQALINNDGIGKISINDKVIVKVNGYPYKEFGVITSKVNAISELPKIIQNANGEYIYLYTIHIELPERLVTNHKKEIMYKPNSAIVAEIITKDKSVLGRLFQTFLSLLND